MLRWRRSRLAYERLAARLVRLSARLERDEVADDAERVAPALPRRDDPLDLVGEEQRADAVVVMRRRQREHRGDFDGQRALGDAARRTASTPTGRRGASA